MRILLSAVAAVALMLPAASYAQRHRHEADRGAQQNAQAEQHQRGAMRERPNVAQVQRPQASPEIARQNFAAEQRNSERNRGNFGAQQNRGQQRFAQQQQRQNGERRNLGALQNQQRFAQEQQQRNAERGRNFDRNGNFGGNRNEFRGGRNFAGRQFAYEGQFRGPVRMGAFHYPRGYGYRHWDRGEYLPSLFLSAPFFIDFNLLGLPPPPPDYRWVRYGPDALLVDVYSGEVVDVIYDAFY